MKTISILASSLLLFTFPADARDSCWHWYGRIKCSIKSGGTLPLYKLDPDYVKNRCKQHPYLAQHKWKDCKPFLHEIINENET
jgi:hypothetical protein